MAACELSMWGDVANIVIAVASVATAIVTARMLIKQHNLQKEQHKLDQSKHNLEFQKFEAHRQEHQPKFQFRRKDGTYIISNEGSELSAPIRVSVHSMITVLSEKFIDEESIDCIYCFPVIYYKQKQPTGKLKGDLISFTYDKEDWGLIQEKVSTLQKRLYDRESFPEDAPLTTILSVRISDVVRITYCDMYNVKRVVHFWDSEQISESQYRQMVMLSHNVPIDLYDPQNIYIEKIVQNVHKTAYELKN